MKNIVSVKNLVKKYKSYTLDIPELSVPEGFATALIGENGAGKTTLCDIISGINMDYRGEVELFGKYLSADEGDVREKTGYTSSVNYFPEHWKIKDVEDVCDLVFKGFSRDEFRRICSTYSFTEKDQFKSLKKLSDGNKMRVMLASVFARDTRLLVLDEPASPLDPLMRDLLCDNIRDYISSGEGEKSVIFSTHNINDMENVTDYAVIISDGKVAEKGFVEELKEKYILVKGELSCSKHAKDFMFTYTENSFGFEGICLSENIDRLAGCDVAFETPGLHQISVAVLKHFKGAGK